MLQIHLSNSLAKVLKFHLQDAIEVDSTALQWYAHFTEVADSPCIVVMEMQSRYAMVFCGDSLAPAEDFPEVFQDRLWREVCVITQLDKPLPESDVAILSDIALDLSAVQHYQKGSQRSVMTHINQVMDQLRYMVEIEGYPIPQTGPDAVSFGLNANDMLRKRKEDKDYFVPLEVFRDFWLGLISVVKAKARVHEPVVSGNQSNVINVDFKKRKKG